VPVDDPDEPKERLQISMSQVAASSAAAVSAAILCSFFGVAGTVIGTAIASMLATVGSALYVHSLRRTKARLHRLHLAGAAAPPITEVIKTARQQGKRLFGQIPWRIAGPAAAAVFALSIAVVTIVEISAGESFSSLFGVSHSGGRDTTLGSLLGAGPHNKHKHKPKPSPSATTTKSPSSSPKPAPTATKTVTAPATSPPPSTPPTTPSASVTPTATPS
jgi:hypothetical protein